MRSTIDNPWIPDSNASNDSQSHMQELKIFNWATNKHVYTFWSVWQKPQVFFAGEWKNPLHIQYRR